MAYKYRKKITIDYTKVLATLTDFPMLVKVTDTNLTKAQTDGADIKFTTLSDVKLSHELIKFNNTTGELIAWVKIPTLSNASNTEIYMYYGDVSATDQQDIANVWNSNYKMVMHFMDNTNDSTSFANTSAITGTLAYCDSQFGRAVTFNRTNFIKVLNNSNWATNGTEIFVSMWLRSRNGANSYDTPWSIGTWSINQGCFTNNSGTNLQFNGGTTSTKAVAMATSTLAYLTNGDTNFHHLAYRANYLGSNAEVYSDGIKVGGDTSIDGMTNFSALDFYIGGSSSAQNWVGDIAEFRLSRVDFGSAWIQTEYNNQYSPSTFYSLGNEESIGASTTVTITNVEWSKNPSNTNDVLLLKVTVNES